VKNNILFQIFRNECNFPVWFSYYVICQAAVFFVLFSQFYVRAYMAPKKKLKVTTNISLKD
jgi:hypothetical protein